MQIADCKSQDEGNSGAVGVECLPAGQAVDLEAVLAAWHTATVRLERTHETRDHQDLDQGNRRAPARPDHVLDDVGNHHRDDRGDRR